MDGSTYESLITDSETGEKADIFSTFRSTADKMPLSRGQIVFKGYTAGKGLGIQRSAG